MLVLAIVLVSLNLRAVITIVGPLVDDIRHDLGISRTAAGMLSTLPLLAFGLVSPLAPRLAARIGSDRALVAAMVVMTAGLAIRPLPPLALLFLGTLAAGCGATIANVLLPALIKRHFAEHAAFMVATYSVVLGVGAAIAAGLAVPTMNWLGGSWRAALALWTIPALLGALAWVPQMRAAPARAVALGEQLRVSLWRDAVAWHVTGFLAFLALGFYAMAAWLPDIYRAHGLSAASAGGLLSVALIVGLPLGLAVGVAAQRMQDQRAIAIASGACLVAGWTGLLVAPLTPSWLWPALLGCGFGSGFPFVLALMVMRAPDTQHAAELSGMSQTIGYTVAALAPVAIGALHDLTHSWTVPLVVLIASTVPEIALAVAASRPRFVSGRSLRAPEPVVVGAGAQP